MTVGNTTFRGNVSLLEAGVAYNQKYVGTSTPGVNQDLFSILVPADFQVIVLQVYVVCVRSGKIAILDNTDDIGGGMTGPGESNFNFSGAPYYVVDEAKTFKLQYQGYSTKPAAPLKAFLQARLIAK